MGNWRLGVNDEANDCHDDGGSNGRIDCPELGFVKLVEPVEHEADAVDKNAAPTADNTTVNKRAAIPSKRKPLLAHNDSLTMIRPRPKLSR